MPKLKKLLQVANNATKKSINWHPGHMYAGLQAMIGKLRTVDCIVEVHDARIPFTGRNLDLKQQLGTIKPHVLVLNKCDLADLSRWKAVKERLEGNGDKNVMLCDLTGHTSLESLNFTKLLDKSMSAINLSNRFNRQDAREFKLMVVGIPNSGKSTLINRIRQHHLGRPGEATKTGPSAGVTRHVEFMIKACSRPPIYVLDTPGVLQPSATKDHGQAMQLALCSSINDKVLNPEHLAKYLLSYLNDREDFFYSTHFGLDNCKISSTKELVEYMREARRQTQLETNPHVEPDVNKYSDNVLLWHFIKLFRIGKLGRIMFDDGGQ